MIVLHTPHPYNSSCQMHISLFPPLENLVQLRVAQLADPAFAGGHGQLRQVLLLLDHRVDALLESVAGDEPVYQHVLVLPDTVSPVGGLASTAGFGDSNWHSDSARRLRWEQSTRWNGLSDCVWGFFLLPCTLAATRLSFTSMRSTAPLRAYVAPRGSRLL